jgi:hypothetical protein
MVRSAIGSLSMPKITAWSSGMRVLSRALSPFTNFTLSSGVSSPHRSSDHMIFTTVGTR